ncbi:[NiFe]-hydrogenase assembly chaperone HybE [Hydrogenophaga electricum]|uniref:[NiFe]-hydrogenase assembly, chaperone, HybE n=1 Tax=Hydrogenophaga electricum TaxID=1230953 RepID=A0ABQ6CE08_9BURK|nr:[NiFe]-hydrogenase assembly chaperone HybE [Hydrogenophaga electricum]GLS16566.1 hypothetical protein GCM10007935_40080 [Hydrogenophaga electricum]
MSVLSHSVPSLDARVAALVAFYRRVQTERMVGVPILNPALSVEAVGFQWGEAVAGETAPEADPVAEGVLITPWFMSLVRLPARAQGHGHRVGRSFVRDFGGERFDFIGAHDPAVGYHETCALFSPMQDFARMDQARETALESLKLVRPAPVPAAVSTTAAPVTTAEPVPSRRAFFLARRPGAGAAP